MWTKIEQLIELSKEPLTVEIDIEKNPERRNYYRFLYHMVSWLKPAVSLEIGVEAGLASAYMAMAAAKYGGWIIGIDLHRPSIFPAQNYYFIEGNSTNKNIINHVNGLIETLGSIGLVYQDSSHHYMESKAEWEGYSPLLSTPSVWICDDITPAFHDPNIDPPGKGMVQYFDELPGDKRLYQDMLHFGNRQGIIVLR